MEHAKILRTEVVPIHSITRHPENARRADMATLEKSLRDHGQYAPVVVHEQTGYIVKGNNTHRALADKIGASEIAATFISCTEQQARAILAVDNKSTDGAGYEDAPLLALLEQLDRDGNLAVSGYTSVDMDDLAALLEESIPDVPDMLDGGVTEESETFDAPAPRADASSGMQSAKSLAELGKDYDSRASRSMQLILPLKQFTWAVELLGQLAERYELDNNADTVLRLIANETGEAIPDVE